MQDAFHYACMKEPQQQIEAAFASIIIFSISRHDVHIAADAYIIERPAIFSKVVLRRDIASFQKQKRRCYFYGLES